MTNERIIIVGGGGDMGAVAARRLLDLRPGAGVALADRDGDRARRRAAALGDERADAAVVDLFDARGLRAAIRGSALVLNAAGPYVVSAAPVLEACIDERVPYLDLGDDLEGADAAFALDRAARDAGITALTGAGIAPGVVNVVARRLAAGLERVDRIRVAWVTGPTPPRPGQEHAGRAVLEHMLHACVGLTATVREGRRVLIPAFRTGEVLDFPAPLGPARVYDLGHAEIATMPRAFPEVREVRSQGGLVPAALAGVFQGIATGVASGRLAWDEAVDALVAVDRGDAPAARALLAGLRGIGAQALRRELPGREAAAFLRMAAGGEAPPAAGGLRVDVAGVRDGAQVARAASAGIGGTEEGAGMDELTGSPAAVFAAMLLDGAVAGPGVVAPEGAVDPDEFAARILPLGLPGTAELLRSPAP